MTQNAGEDRIAELIELLSSTDPATRRRARGELAFTGGSKVARALVAALSDPHTHVRWEAAKALVTIADPVAASALKDALDDEDDGVRWVAGEALVALGEAGLMTVLSGLTQRARSVNYCKSAHHVLHQLEQRGHQDLIQPVLKALEASEPEAGAPVAAYHALEALRGG